MGATRDCIIYHNNLFFLVSKSVPGTELRFSGGHKMLLGGLNNVFQCLYLGIVVSALVLKYGAHSLTVSVPQVKYIIRARGIIFSP